MSVEDMYQELLSKMRDLKEEIREKSIDWWWLDQGDAPIISVSKIKLTKDGFEKVRLPKVSIKVALNTLIENMEQGKSFTKKQKVELLNAISDDLEKLVKIRNIIREAHELIVKIDRLMQQIELVAKDNEKAKLMKIAKGTISWIREVVMKTPMEWDKRKETFENVANKLSREINDYS